MLITIIVPVYNADDTIRKCLNSILAQTFKDYEVIIVNDGSTDDTTKICTEYVSNYENFKMLYQSNRGVAISRRRGIKVASGKYIVFVDSDDTINKYLLQNIANTLKKNPNLDIIRYQANLINDEAHKNHNRYNFMDETDTIRSGLYSLKLWTNPSIKYAVYWLFAFNRSLFSREMFPDIRCYEDVAYIPILIASASNVITIDYHGYNYTCNRYDSLTNSQNLNDFRKRAVDFYNAYNFATENFTKLPGITQEDVNFFNNDYRRRLNDFYNGLPEEIKSEFTKMYGICT